MDCFRFLRTLDQSLARMSSFPVVDDSLNDQQRQAVESIYGPVLVLAGAGTGKTRVLTTRLAHILNQGYAYPSQILAVTFTNKAAAEMRERVIQLIGRSAEGLWLGTFHALAVKILRRYGELLGLRSDFTILDTDDQIRLIKQILQAHNIDEKKHPAKLVSIVINRWKDRGLTPHKVSKAEQAGNPLLLKIYQEYQQRLLTLNAVDFGDLLLHNLTLFSEHPEVLQQYQQQFHFILVDEYQDTNVAQYLWLRLLAQGQGNICCVGDDDQSIYAWRGAEIGNILRFEQDFPGATVVRLEQNYRSTPHILGAASGLIKKNSGRLGKTLWTERDVGDKVMIRGTWDSEVEARVIADDIESRQRQGEKLLSMAILVRAGFQTREFEDRLLVLGIPYRVIGGLRFYERQEIRDALAYLRLLNQLDDGLAFERIINTPRRGIGTATLQQIHKYAREHQISLPRAALLLTETDEIRGAARTGLRQFFGDMDRWRQKLETESHVDIVQMVLEESGYTDMWRQDKSADAPGRLENLKELIRALEEFSSLQDFLEHVSLVMENTQQSNEDMISLMTLHAAKGLEFDTVYLAGWEEGLFPHQRSLDENGVEGLEEERRLAYVGITRAKQNAIISYALNRRTYQGWQSSRPSRFINELPKEHITLIQPNGREAGQQSTVQRTPHFSPVTRVIDAEFTIEVSHEIEKNDRVFHQKFGYGRVVFVDGNQLHIHFETSGLKKIMAHFVEKA
jgi:DNA helicase II / ATP-dependent DNA helicase PcrA